MSAAVLEHLKSEEFALSVGFLSTAPALRRFLARSGEIRDIREGLRQGAISDDTLRRFVSSLLQDFQRDERFRHELAVAAVAVAIERRDTDFAEEFLHDLAHLKVAEISLCAQVARECLDHRVSVIRDVPRVFDLRRPAGNGPFSISASPLLWNSSSVGVVAQSFTCGVG
jgi:hypothetical protein